MNFSESCLPEKYYFSGTGNAIRVITSDCCHYDFQYYNFGVKITYIQGAKVTFKYDL